MSSTTPFPGLTTSNLVTLESAQESIRRYIAHVKSEANPTYAFLIAHKDLLTALQIESSEDDRTLSMFRVYFGLGSEEVDFKMRLFLTPVNDSGEDVLPLGTDGKLRVYDFNLPCPTTCDVNSPLYYGNLKP